MLEPFGLPIIASSGEPPVKILKYRVVTLLETPAFEAAQPLMVSIVSLVQLPFLSILMS